MCWIYSVTGYIDFLQSPNIAIIEYWLKNSYTILNATILFFFLKTKNILLVSNHAIVNIVQYNKM